MRALVALAAVPLAGLLGAQSAPEIPSSGIVSAADNSSASLGLARGSIFTIYGRNLALATARAEGSPLPTSLGGARVRVRGSGTYMEAPLLYVSPSQINAILPAEMGSGLADVFVETAAGASATAIIAVVEARFTAFTSTRRPFGPAVIQQYGSSGITLNRFLNPAVAGDNLVLWGTGLGSQRRDDVIVYIGLLPVKPFYAGPALGLPGVDQINLIVPNGLVSRCFHPFLVRAGGRDSPVYTLSTGANRGPCPTEIALGESGLETLDRGGTVQVTVLTVQYDSIGADQRQMAEAWSGEYDAGFLGLLVTYDWGDAAPISCSQAAYSYTRSTAPPSLVLPAELYGIRRSSGLAVSVTGPVNCRWLFGLLRNGVYRAAGPPGCPAQDYSISVPYISSASGKVPPPQPAPPAAQVEFRRLDDWAAVSWNNPAAARLTVDLSSSFTLPGNIVNGLTYARRLSCWLSGYSGTGQIRASQVSWAIGLPTNQSASFRLSLAGLQGGSWGSPTHALVIRTVQAFQNALPVR